MGDDSGKCLLNYRLGGDQPGGNFPVAAWAFATKSTFMVSNERGRRKRLIAGLVGISWDWFIESGAAEILRERACFYV